MAHLKILYMSSIPTTISPKFAGPIRKASSTYLACAGQQTFRNPLSVKARVSLASRLYLARVIGSPRTSSWDIPMAHSQGESFLFLPQHNRFDFIASFQPSQIYIPHHRHSLRWKRSGDDYSVHASENTRIFILISFSQCTTNCQRPCVILEPAIQRAPPQLKILDPLFRLGASKPQRMHNGLPLSLLDFLLVTAMLLVTPSEEWMNVTRSSPSCSFPDDGNIADASPVGAYYHLQIRSLLQAPYHRELSTQQPCTPRRPPRRSSDGGPAYRLAS